MSLKQRVVGAAKGCYRVSTCQDCGEFEEKKKREHSCQLGKVRFMVCMSIFKSSLVSRKSALIPSERFFFVVYVCASGRGLAGESSYRVDGQAGSASLCLFS